MRIVVTDGATLNPGDLSWEGLGAFGTVRVYSGSTPGETIERCGNADAVIVNKVVFDQRTIDALPELKYIGVTATGYNIVDVAAAAGRGIVDSAALARALADGRIAGAGLDVLDLEPPPADHPLLRARNVTLTAHVAGYHGGMFDDFWRLSIESIADLVRGRYPASVVNPHVKPRWPLTPRPRA